MSEITLEMVDKVIERTGVSYGEAKRALEVADGNVLDAIIYIEDARKAEEEASQSDNAETMDEFKAYLKGLIDKGNLTRIRIKKDDKVIVDVPVNAGIAAGVIGIIIPQLLAIGIATAIVTKLTIEITKENGDVEEINKYVKAAYDDIKDKASAFAEVIKEKVNEMKSGVKTDNYTNKKDGSSDDKFYTYTVKFHDEE